MPKRKPSPCFCIVSLGISSSLLLITWVLRIQTSGTEWIYISPDPQPATMAETQVKNWAYQENVIETPLRFRSDIQKKRIESVCSSLGMEASISQLHQSMKGRVVVDDKHKMLACLIPKVGCTNLGRIFGVLTGIVKSKDPEAITPYQYHHNYKYQLTFLKNLSPKKMAFRINNYTSFVFVRDPFERLISAYRNKLMNPTERGFRKIRDAILNAYRTNKTLQGGLTFEEFATYLSDPDTKLPPNIHWMPFYKLCRPCEVQYGFIANLATFAQDLQYVLDKNNLTEAVNVPDSWMRNTTQSFNKTDQFMKEYYSSIPNKMLKRLYNILLPDYIIFNMTLPNAIKELMMG